MEVASVTWRKWGTVAWGIAFAGLAMGGVLDSLLNKSLQRISQPGPRNSTDTMLMRKLNIPDGTAKLRDLLTGTEPPKPGVTWVFCSDRDPQLEEVWFVISLLTWPQEVKYVIWKRADGAPKMPGAGQRVFFLGKPPKEEVPGLQAISPNLWFKSGKETL